MRKLEVPSHAPLAVFDHCTASVPDVLLRGRLAAQRGLVEQKFNDFALASVTRSWCTLPRSLWGNPHQVVVGNLTKNELNDLYGKRMVGAAGPARDIYDQILVAAGGRCPLCGGIGHAAGLDHFLPKAYFPVFSVLPQNLVPSCQDCNKGIGSGFALQIQDQVLNPYFDDNKFFEDRWICLRFLEQNILKFIFEICPPPNWNADEVRRATAHFESFNLQRRYAIEAGAEVANVLHLRRSLGTFGTMQNLRDLVAAQASSPALDLNGWRRTFYAGLHQADWFFD